MSIATRTKQPQQPPNDPDAHLLEAVRTALSKSGSLRDRALAIAKLGHPVWYANSDDRGGYELIQLEGRGSMLPENADRLLTTDEEILAKPRFEADALAFRIVGADGKAVLYAWAKGRAVVEPFRVVQRAAHDTATATRLPAAKPIPKAPVHPVVLVDREVAADRICQHDAQVAALEQKIRESREQSASIKSQAGLDEEQIETLTETRSDRAAKSIRTGEDIGDEAAETKEIAKLQLRIDASTKALTANAVERAGYEAALVRLREQRVAAIVDWAGAEHTLAVTDLRAALADLAPLLVRVAAVDRAKLALIGTDRLVTDRPNHPGLTAGEKLIAALAAAIPEVIRPAELSAASLTPLTGKAAARLLSSMTAD